MRPDDVADSAANSKVPGALRRSNDALSEDQLAVTHTRIPAHCDSEQGTGHHPEQIQEDSLLTGGTLTMHLGDAIETVRAPVGHGSRPAPPARSATKGQSGQSVAGARKWAIAQVRGPSRPAAADYCFRRWCLQSNRSLLAIRLVRVRLQWSDLESICA